MERHYKAIRFPLAHQFLMDFSLCSWIDMVAVENEIAFNLGKYISTKEEMA